MILKKKKKYLSFGLKEWRCFKQLPSTAIGTLREWDKNIYPIVFQLLRIHCLRMRYAMQEYRFKALRLLNVRRLIDLDINLTVNRL